MPRLGDARPRGTHQVTDHDPASLTTPGGYLEEAQTAARNIRAWVGRQSKPEYAGYTSNTVDWVVGVLDTLDLVLTRATQSVDHHMPLHRPQQRSPEQSLNVHQLKAADKDRLALADWAHKLRWSLSGQVSGDELDHLDVLIRSLRGHLSHLTAQAQDEELAR